MNEVNLKRYVTDLSELVVESYYNYHHNVTLGVNCSIDKMRLVKAMPLGLILVELISNSIKYAFKDVTIAHIKIDIRLMSDEYVSLIYSDNGQGFDFENSNTQGLGIEIIKGLIGQLDGEYKYHLEQGFELAIVFKY